jgi:hypothetical protein
MRLATARIYRPVTHALQPAGMRTLCGRTMPADAVVTSGAVHDVSCGRCIDALARSVTR